MLDSIANDVQVTIIEFKLLIALVILERNALAAKQTTL
jgi:hypothetical protein